MHTHTQNKTSANKSRNVAGYKINTEMSSDFYTLAKKKKKSKKEILKTILFIVASQRIKYLVINLTKEVHGLHTEKYKTLIK